MKTRKKKHSYRFRKCPRACTEILTRLSLLDKGQFEVLSVLQQTQMTELGRKARVELGQRLYSAIYGNTKFVESLCEKAGAGDDEQSLLRRMNYVADMCVRLLCCDGVCPIAPKRNQPFDASVHRAVGTAELGAGDAPGTVAECLEVGYAVSGVTVPADVVVFDNGK